MKDIKNALEEMIQYVLQKKTHPHPNGSVIVDFIGFAERIINGKQVTLSVIENCRNSKAKDKPRLQWKVNNKVVKQADLLAKIE